MTIQHHIDAYIAGQPEPKRADLLTLHARILEWMPGCRLWFLDGRDAAGKIVSNPSIGYGFQRMRYADGSGRDFYQTGVSANTGGLSVYIMGLDDKTALAERFGPTLGKAKVTGYCVRFKALKDIELDVLGAAVRYGVEVSGGDRHAG